jgi:hypothetical protein
MGWDYTRSLIFGILIDCKRKRMRDIEHMVDVLNSKYKVEFKCDRNEDGVSNSINMRELLVYVDIKDISEFGCSYSSRHPEIDFIDHTNYEFFINNESDFGGESVLLHRIKDSDNRVKIEQLAFMKELKENFRLNESEGIFDYGRICY